MVDVNVPQTQDLLRGCACAVVLALLLSLDAWKAIRRKAYWFPGRLLVLSAFTLQFINYVNYGTVKVASGSDPKNDDAWDDFWLVINSGRVLIYVFVAYLLPGLVSSGFTSVWTNIGALTLTVLAHMLSEFLVGLFWFDDPCDSILFTTNILLVLLCICAVLAGKTIRFIMNQKVPALLSCCSNSSCRDCGNIGDHVLKCWIVVRCSQLEYIMARSALSSLAGVLVTACLVQMVVGWKIYYAGYVKFAGLNRATFYIQFAFILIGWIAVAIRWLSAVIYFSRYGQCSFQMEDFWRRSLFDLKYSGLNGPFWEKIDRNRTLLHTLVFMGLFVQIFVVLLSKASLLLSWLLFWPLLMAREKIMLLFGSSITKSQFSKYREILESIAMPGENAESLWIANESAFKSTKENMEQGRGSTEDLIKIIRRLKAEAPVADEGEEIYVEEEKYLKYSSKMSSKMRAVSLVHFMLCFYEDTNYEVVGDAFKACSEAWALMDFVESSDGEANLVSLVADKEFSSLKNIWKKNPIQSEEKLAIKNRMQKDIESRISKGESQERVNNMRDSMDWMTAAADMSLNKISKEIESKKIDLRSANAIHDLGSLLAKVIVNCLEKELNNALIKKCCKWAVEGKEEKIYHAAFLAGKAMGVTILNQSGQDNNAVPLAAVAEGAGNDSSGIAEVAGAV